MEKKIFDGNINSRKKTTCTIRVILFHNLFGSNIFESFRGGNQVEIVQDYSVSLCSEDIAFYFPSSVDSAI